MIRNRYRMVLLLLIGMLATTGCVKRTGGGTGTGGLSKEDQTQTSVTEIETDARGNTTDCAIVTAIDETVKQITVQSVDSTKSYILNYNGGTSIQNRYGREVLLSEISVGEIVDIYYMSGIQKLISIKESEQIWEQKDIRKWTVDTDAKRITVGSEKYFYDDNLLVFSNGKEIDIHQLNSVDTLIVRGIDKEIHSIDVQVGHGYIKITDETNLIGGLIEVGTNLMKEITEGMVIVAPEGDYTLTASRAGVGGSTDITVVRDEELTVSLSAFQGEVERQGAVKFHIKPEKIEYNIFVDGKEVSSDEEVSLTYGTHTVVVTSDTYADYTEKIVVSSVYMNKTIDLALEDTTQETTTVETTTSETAQTETTLSSSQTTTNTSLGNSSSEENTTVQAEEREDGVESSSLATNNNYIVVNGPEGVEVYFDGELQGTAPLTFPKESGEHIFVLRKDGYITTAYSYEFDESTADVYIKFPNLEEKK